VQNGDLRLVRNDRIRFRVIDYVALIQATEVLLRHTESLIWNSTERVYHELTVHSRSAGRGGDSGSWTQLDVKALLNDPDIVSALRVQVAASNNRLGSLHGLEDPTNELIRLLQAELGRK
jgi:hypothetical protein